MPVGAFRGEICYTTTTVSDMARDMPREMGR